VFVSRSTDRAADITATVIGIQTEADHTGPSTDWRPSDRLQEGSPAEQDSRVHVDNPGTELSLISAAAFTATAEYIWGLFSIATATLTGIPQQGQAPDIRRAFWRFQRHCVRREGQDGRHDGIERTSEFLVGDNWEIPRQGYIIFVSRGVSCKEVYPALCIYLIENQMMRSVN